MLLNWVLPLVLSAVELLMFFGLRGEIGFIDYGKLMIAIFLYPLALFGLLYGGAIFMRRQFIPGALLFIVSFVVLTFNIWKNIFNSLI